MARRVWPCAESLANRCALASPASCVPRLPESSGVAVILAVMRPGFGGDGWESNPPRTPQQRPANGFEDRGAAIQACPCRSAGVRLLAIKVQDQPLSSADMH